MHEGPTLSSSSYSPVPTLSKPLYNRKEMKRRLLSSNHLVLQQYFETIYKDMCNSMQNYQVHLFNVHGLPMQEFTVCFSIIFSLSRKWRVVKFLHPDNLLLVPGGYLLRGVFDGFYSLDYPRMFSSSRGLASQSVACNIQVCFNMCTFKVWRSPGYCFSKPFRD